jgi:hypothetical protein
MARTGYETLEYLQPALADSPTERALSTASLAPARVRWWSQSSKSCQPCANAFERETAEEIPYMAGDGTESRDRTDRDTFDAKSAPREQEHTRDSDFLVGGHRPTAKERLIRRRRCDEGSGVCGGAKGRRRVHGFLSREVSASSSGFGWVRNVWDLQNGGSLGRARQRQKRRERNRGRR